MKSKEPDCQGESPAAGDFSLIPGGPLYQLFRRTHLSGTGLELLRRWVIVITLFAWLPLLILSLLEGHAWGGTEVPFLKDVDAQVRFLFALPMLIVAEMVVHQRMNPVFLLCHGPVPSRAKSVRNLLR